MPYSPTGPADSPPCLPHPPCTARCCILQRFKFRKFGKFRLLELCSGRAIITHDLSKTRKETNSAVGREFASYGRRSSFDPHGYPHVQESPFDKINRRFKITIVSFIQKTCYVQVSNSQLQVKCTRALQRCHWNTRLRMQTNMNFAQYIASILF